MSTDKKPLEYLAAYGLKATPLRLALMELFLQTPRAQTAPEVLAALNARRRLHKVTVYRMLTLFTQKGLLRKLSLTGRTDYYELAGGICSPHPHFQCLRCGAVQCLEPIDLSPWLAWMPERAGNLVLRVSIRMEGLCQKCREPA
ncbi:MAG: Fur family transcriptional regulator [Desulfobacca sp.]|uniref:Fur family transcriptional regulator n=1 Tax=Desulfobacca sp. TaxID=2067990 RepID=UPI00404A8899